MLSQPIDNQSCGWTSPCGSYNGCKMLLVITISKLKKRSFIHRPWKAHDTPGTASCGHREKERRESVGWGSAVIDVGGGLGFHGFTFSWWV